MNSNYLEFEQPIAELQAKIDELKNVGSDNAMNLDEEIQRLQSKMRTKIKAIFKDLTPWQISQLSRHPLRLFLGFFDRSDHVESGFRQIVVFAVDNRTEPFDGVFQFNILARRAGEDFRHEERL